MEVEDYVKRKKEDKRGPYGLGRVLKISNVRFGRTFEGREFALVQWDNSKSWLDVQTLEVVNI